MRPMFSWMQATFLAHAPDALAEPFVALYIACLLAVYLAVTYLTHIGVLGDVVRTRAVLARVQKRLGIKTSKQQSDAAWGKGAGIFVVRTATAPLRVWAVLLLLAEGHLVPALNVFLQLLALLLLLMLPQNERTERWFAHYTNTQALMQCLMLILFLSHTTDAEDNSAVLDRAVLFRAASSFSYIESADLLLIQLAMVTMSSMFVRRVLLGREPMSAAFVMLFATISFLLVTEARGRATARVTKAMINRNSGKILLLAFIPALFAMSGLTRTAILRDMAPLQHQAGGTLLLVSLLLLLNSERVDYPDHHLLKSRQAGLVVWVLMVLRMALVQACLSGLQQMAGVEWFSGSAFWGVIPVQGVVLVFIEAPLARCLAECLGLAGVLLVLAQPSHQFVVQIACLLAVSLFSNVSIRMARHSAKKMMSIDASTQNFIDHALKQKLVGVGSAIEHALTMGDTGNSDLLRQALIECKYGHDMCHFAAVARRIQQDSYISCSSVKTLDEVLVEWTERLPPAISLCNDSPYSPPIELDWELAWLLATKLSGRGARGVIRLLYLQDELPRARVRIIVQRSAKFVPWQLAEVKRSSAVVVKFMNGSLDDSSGSMLLPALVRFRPKSAKVLMSPVLSADVEEPELELGLPANLKIALLDDNVLSRRSMARFFARHMACSEDSIFSRGGSFAEATNFVAECMAMPRPPDIVVFDQHLEYDGLDDVLLGVDLAIKARNVGFSGCIIIHTANSQVREALDFKVVDGFLEKSLSTRVLLQGMHDAWKRYVERVKKYEG